MIFPDFCKWDTSHSGLQADIKRQCCATASSGVKLIFPATGQFSLSVKKECRI